MGMDMQMVRLDPGSIILESRSRMTHVMIKVFRFLILEPWSLIGEQCVGNRLVIFYLFFSFKSSLGIGWLHWGKNGSHPIASTNLNGTFVHGFKSFVKSIHMH